jgi:hypothetical protein
VRLCIRPRFSPGLGEEGAAVIRDHSLAADTFAFEPGHYPQQETSRCGLLLIRQYLAIGQACSVIELEEVLCLLLLLARHTLSQEALNSPAPTFSLMYVSHELRQCRG